jgi:hypothetical protein
MRKRKGAKEAGKEAHETKMRIVFGEVMYEHEWFWCVKAALNRRACCYEDMKQFECDYGLGSHGAEIPLKNSCS